jgi:hypothetical protein
MLQPAQKARDQAAIAIDILPMLEAEAKERQATSTGGANPQLVELFPQAEKGKARAWGVNFPPLVESAPLYSS